MYFSAPETYQYQNLRKIAFFGHPGDKLRARHPLFDHVGTLNWDGRVWAASNRFQGIRLVSLEDFLGAGELINEGHIGPRSRTDVLRCYEEIASDGYCVLSKNCEHIDNHARGLGYCSPQMDDVLKVAAVTALSLLLIAAIARR